MYTPSPLPSSQDLRQYVEAELLRIAQAFESVQGGVFLPVTTVAPTKPRESMVKFADGTGWNPGSGKGLYVYYGGAWHFAG